MDRQQQSQSQKIQTTKSTPVNEQKQVQSQQKTSVAPQKPPVPKTQQSLISLKQAENYLAKFEEVLGGEEIAEIGQLYDNLTQLGNEVYKAINCEQNEDEKSKLTTVIERIKSDLAYMDSLCDQSEDDEDEIEIPEAKSWETEIIHEKWKQQTDAGSIKKNMIEHVEKAKTLDELNEVSEQILTYDADQYGQKLDMVDIYNALVNKRKALAKDAFELPLVIAVNEKANDYHLYPIPNGTSIMSKQEFQDMWKLWSQEQKEGVVAWEDFKQQFANSASQSWYVLDKNGQPVEEFFKLQKGSKEQSEQAKKIFAENCKTLYQLPYPKRLLLASLKMNGANSVQQCNFICEWVKKKAQQVSALQKKK